MTTVTPAVKQALDFLGQLGDAYRGDWAEFDGRVLRTQLVDVRLLLTLAITGDEDLDEVIVGMRANNGLCPFGRGHWQRYCPDLGCEQDT